MASTEGKRELPTLLYQLPRCPACQSTDLEKRKKIKQPDDLRSHYATCRGCGKRYVMIAE